MTLCGWKIFSKSKQRAKRLKNETIPPSSSDNPTPVTEERSARESAVLESDQDVQDEWSLQSDSKEDAESNGNPRNKCALKPGHSLMDWIRFGTSGVDLAGTKGVITPISMAELAKHNKLTDAWLAIRGKVYNVTHYMDFHPGGPEEIAKGLGKDATKMFDEVHAWVNYEQLLMKCYIGPLRSIGVIDLEPLKLKPKPSSANGSNFKTPILPFFGSISEKSSPAKAKPGNSPSSSNEKPEIIPRFDWIQKTSDLILVFYTKPFCNPGLIVTYKSDSELDVRILIERTTYLCCFKLSHEVKWPCSIKVTSETGKIELILSKLKPELWTAYGILDRHKITNPENIDFEYSIAKNVQITHDSYALVLKPVQKTIIITPIGYHISVTAFVNGDYVTRRYTPVPAIFLPTECANPYLPLLIKSYTSGVMAKHITSESYDSVLKLSQPKGNFLLSDLGNHVRVGLLAAGSGITPILGILDHLTARNINKVENIQLLLFNKTEEDIWCRQRLQDFATKDNRLIIRHVLSEPQDSWTGETGRISKELISSLTNPKQNFHVTYFCVCGPTPFNDLSERLLKENGFTLFNMHFFQG